MRIYKHGVLVALLALTSSLARATSGIDCQSVDGTLKIYTEEGLENGDNVITLGIVAPWVQSEPIIFSKLLEEVSVSRDAGVVYMASNSSGASLTLILNNAQRDDALVSTAYLKAKDAIYVETMSCN